MLYRFQFVCMYWYSYVRLFDHVLIYRLCVLKQVPIFTRFFSFKLVVWLHRFDFANQQVIIADAFCFLDFFHYWSLHSFAKLILHREIQIFYWVANFQQFRSNKQHLDLIVYNGLRWDSPATNMFPMWVADSVEIPCVKPTSCRSNKSGWLKFLNRFTDRGVTFLWSFWRVIRTVYVSSDSISMKSVQLYLSTIATSRIVVP